MSQQHTLADVAMDLATQDRASAGDSHNIAARISTHCREYPVINGSCRARSLQHLPATMDLPGGFNKQSRKTDDSDKRQCTEYSQQAGSSKAPVFLPRATEPSGRQHCSLPRRDRSSQANLYAAVQSSGYVLTASRHVAYSVKRQQHTGHLRLWWRICHALH